MNAAQIKRINHIKHLIRDFSEKELQEFVSDKKNSLMILDAIIGKFFQKPELNKIFEPEVFKIFLNNIDLSLIVNDLDFYNLVNSYGVDRYVTAKMYNSDLYKMLEELKGSYMTATFLALLFGYRKCHAPELSKELMREFSYHVPLYNYWSFLKGKTLDDNEILGIINDKFKTDFQKISDITLNEEDFNPQIVEFAVQLGYKPPVLNKVYNGIATNP